jgi:hypothetical protein
MPRNLRGPAAKEEYMQELDLHLDSGQRAYLVGLLEVDLEETRVEIRRADTPRMHDQLLEKEKLIKGLLSKLRPTT